MNARDHALADFARTQATLPGARVPWLVSARRNALERFAQNGFPGARDEEWKYTSVAAIEKNAFLAASPQSGHDQAAAALVEQFSLTGSALHLLVFVNGRYRPALSAPGRLPAGATLKSLAAALESSPEALEPYLANTNDQTLFGALNTAFMADGAYLHLARGTVVEQPIQLLFIATEAGAAGAMISPRNLIVAEDGAQATVIEHYAGSDGAAYLTNAVTQIFAGANAAIEHYKLQQEALQSFHIAGMHAQQGRDSRLLSHAVSLGALLARNDLTTSFAATGCDATFDGLYLAGGRQHVDHHTRIDHAQPNGTSRETYRGVLDGHSRAVFNGKIIVRPGAQKTDARQANHNLLLSRDAEIDTKPQLEIYADDVKCTHGATVGQLDDNQLFYLRARGIAETMARSLLVHAFASDLVERIRVASLRSRLEQILFSRLPQGERIRELS